MPGRLRSLLPAPSHSPHKTHHRHRQGLFSCNLSDAWEKEGCKETPPAYKPSCVGSEQGIHRGKQHSLGSDLLSLCQEGLLDTALHRLEQLSTPPSHNVYLSFLKACHKRKALPHSKRIHAHLALHKVELTRSLGEHLVITFVKCGALEDALHIFHRLPCRTAFSWTAIISGFTDCGRGHEALQMYVYMQEDGVVPDPYTFVSLFKACGSISGLEVGRKLHAVARRKGFTSDVFAATTLVSMYGKCGAIKEAEDMFVGLPHGDCVPWNAMLSAYMEQGQGEKALQLYAQMQVEGLRPNKQALVIALQACGTLAEKEDMSNTVDGGQSAKLMSLEIGQALHADARREGLASDIYVSTTLVSMYGKCGTSQKAEKVFIELALLDVVPWTAMLSAYVEQDEKAKAIQLYRQMQMEGVGLNQQTLVCALKACGTSTGKDGNIFEEGLSTKMFLEIGKAIHADARRRGLALDLFVSNALVSMYGKYAAIVDAENAFDGSMQHDVVSWTAMLSIYVEQGHGEKALHLYRQMHDEGVSPNHHTFVMALQACGILAEKEKANYVKDGQPKSLMSLEIVKALHVDAQRKGFASNVFIGTTLVSIYGKCGSLVEAEGVFIKMLDRNTVSWNAMLSTYAEHGQGAKALKLYRQMVKEKVAVDVCTLVCILQACSETGAVDTCRKLHFAIICSGHDHNRFLASTLIHAYGSSASMVDAEAVACGRLQPDIVSWNACIAGYAGEGQCVASLHMFEEMQLVDLEPTGASFTSLFSACSHEGLIDPGVKYFESMGRHYSITPELKHYVNIVDLLGRAGDFKKVGNILRRMPMQADVDIWSCLLAACCTHGNIELGKLAFSHAVNLQSKQAAAYVLMSNIYADVELQVCVELENSSLEETWSELEGA